MFVPQNFDLRNEYDFCEKITTAMPENSVGVVTSRDALTIHETAEKTLSTIRVNEYSRDELIEALLNVMEKRTWHEREDVLIAAARGLGFARTGRHIRAAFKSAINGAIRRNLIESEGSQLRLR
jgi:hypothetical protein